MSTLPLFGDSIPPLRAKLAGRLRSLASEGIWIGTSSWKYPGWMGQIYSEERYLSRGRFSQKRFEQECLAEYAECFPAVCGDFTFYQFPGEAYWRKLFASAPPTLRYALKVPEEITCRRFSVHARYGERGGTGNPSFLNAGLLADAFLLPLEPFRDRIAVLIFEFGAGSAPLVEFVDRLDAFLTEIPGGWRYAVEVRNASYLDTVYFDCLRQHGAAHVFNSWSRMPELGSQIEIPGAFTAGFSVTRALLRPGRLYEEAVERFAPYREVQDPNPGARDAMRRIIGRARKEREEAFVFVNNRLEGNAPGTIEAITE